MARLRAVSSRRLRTGLHSTPSARVAHLLVGVYECTDDATGSSMANFVACRRPGPGGRAHPERRQRTRPIPVDIFIIEEAARADIPFVRVEVDRRYRRTSMAKGIDRPAVASIPALSRTMSFYASTSTGKPAASQHGPVRRRSNCRPRLEPSARRWTRSPEPSSTTSLNPSAS